MNKDSIKEGQYVHYAPGHGKKENGRVKSITEHAVFVVYNCDGNWDHYKDYTGANTNPKDLREGWVDKEGHPDPDHCDHEYRSDSYKWGNPHRMTCHHCGNVIND